MQGEGWLLLASGQHGTQHMPPLSSPRVPSRQQLSLSPSLFSPSSLDGCFPACFFHTILGVLLPADDDDDDGDELERSELPVLFCCLGGNAQQPGSCCIFSSIASTSLFSTPAPYSTYHRHQQPAATRAAAGGECACCQRGLRGSRVMMVCDEGLCAPTSLRCRKV